MEGEDPRLNQMKKSYTMSQSSKKALQGAREVVKKEKKEYSLIFNDIMVNFVERDSLLVSVKP